MERRALLAALVALAAGAPGCRRKPPPPPGGARIVSLAPGLTDTLFAIGAGPLLVARSDYCDYPPEALRLPRVGTSITPQYETITRLSPTLIVGEAGAAARKRELEAIGTTRLLPWLTLDEIVASTRELGGLTGTRPAAGALAARLAQRLSVPAPPNGPRVLLVIGYQPGKLDELWFIRENSLHGAALRAAGARNAVPEAVSGLPRLSPERLLELDPDAIFVLVEPGKAVPGGLDVWQKLGPLRALKRGTLRYLEAPEAYVHGPRILTLVDRLAAAVRRLEGPT
jgi:ABC-type Fe3+-hydroxamate transport system substrate-binding protein